jgi:ketosteroid isomerase-like protein
MCGVSAMDCVATPGRRGVSGCEERDAMSETARETIERFWEIQNGGDYRQLVPLFADDAVLVDPIYGRFEGRTAIAGFMDLMVREMGDRKIRFRLEEVAGDGAVAWAQWVAETPRGLVSGCGLYRVRDGRLTYYRDYMNAPAAGG